MAQVLTNYNECERCTHLLQNNERVLAYGQILCAACYDTLSNDPDMDIIRKRFDKCMACGQKFEHNFKCTWYCGDCEYNGRANASRLSLGQKIGFR